VNQPRVSVIIATWSVQGVIARCLNCVERQEVPGGFETIVVEDASTDGTADVLRQRSDQLRIIWNDRNEGFSRANNRAADQAKGDVLCFLNADAELVTRDVLARLADVLQTPGIGIAGPKIVNPDGSLQPSCAAHPTVLRALVVGCGLQRVLPQQLVRRLAPEFWSHEHPLDTDWLLGAVLVVRRDLFRELGGFWSTLYSEDQDLAYRAQRLGWRVRYDDAAVVMHVGNFSFGQQGSDALRAARVAHAELTFLRAHYAWPRAVAIRAVVGGGYAARALLHALLGHTSEAAIYRAMARVYASYRPAPVPQPTIAGASPPGRRQPFARAR